MELNDEDVKAWAKKKLAVAASNLSAAQAAFDKAEAAYEAIQGLLPNSDSVLNIPRPPAPKSEMTIGEAISKVLTNFSTSDYFTVSDVEGYLHQMGYEVGGKSPRATISSIMIKMAENGEIRLVRKGAGSTPSTYRLPTEAEEKQDESIDFLN